MLYGLRALQLVLRLNGASQMMCVRLHCFLMMTHSRCIRGFILRYLAAQTINALWRAIYLD